MKQETDVNEDQEQKPPETPDDQEAAGDKKDDTKEEQDMLYNIYFEQEEIQEIKSVQDTDVFANLLATRKESKRQQFWNLIAISDCETTLKPDKSMMNRRKSSRRLIHQRMNTNRMEDDYREESLMKSEDEFAANSLDSDERLMVEEDMLKDSINDMLGIRQQSFNDQEQKKLKLMKKRTRQNSSDNLI